MKKRILSILLCCVMLAGMLPTAALAAGPDVWDGSTKAPSGGGKSESDPYLISTGEELAWLATLEAERSYYVKFTNDIILNEGTFDQNGNLSTSATPKEWTPAPKAVWYIDGNNHYISGMYINSNEGNVGLFRYLYGYSYSKGYVRDLTIKNSYVRLTRDNPQYGNGKAGVFAGESFRTEYTNCFSENNIVSTNCYATGGIVGSSQEDTFNGVHTSGSISGSNSLGGLAGMVSYDSVFKNCWNEASIPSGSYRGGIVGDGRNSSEYYNCANLGSGGITGSGGRTIKNCYILSEVDGYGGAAKLLTTLNDNLYEMDGMSDLNTWVMGTGGYPLPTGDTFEDKTKYYNIWLDGVRVGERNQGNILKNGLASYDNVTNTLYLHDGLVVTKAYNESLLYTKGDINLCVDGSVEFRSAQNVGSGPSVIKLGEAGGSCNLKIYAPTGKSAAVTVTGAYSEYGINVNSLTLDGDICLTVRTNEPCFAFAYTFTLQSSKAVLDAENLSGGQSMLNFVSSVNLPSTNPQKLYEGTGTDLKCVTEFTKERKTESGTTEEYMYPHIRIAPEVYGLSDTLPKSLTVSMTQANTQAALSTWAAGEIRKGDITASNSEITVSDVVPAVAGSNANESGTDGSFTVTVKLTQNGISKTTTIPGTITATAYVPPAHTHCICGGDTDVGDHTTHTNVTYQPWDGTSAIDYGDDNTAYVCLTDNVTIQSNLEIPGGKTLYLCLNGKTFASNGTKKIEMRENSRFILCDCVGGGTIDGADNCWGGAGIYLHNSTMDMYGGKITGGHTGNGGGGAIALDDVNCVFNMYGGEISGNKADRYGGAIFLNGTLQTNKGGTVNLYGGTISNNSAQIGGAIYAVYGGTVNLFGGEISGNKATANGGGAICLNHSGVLNMTGGKMQNNTAKTDGGAVNLYASTFTFSGGTISGNHASEYGGAVYLSISGKLNMTGGEICNNTAAEEGGAVHVYGQNATFNFSGGTITGNEANKDGGAVYLNQENSTLNMTGGEISGNKATRNGGAVYMFRATSTLNLSGGTIKNNTAGSSGGAVYFNTTSDGKIQGILNISGNPVVKDNTVSGKANNIAMKTGKTLSIVAAMTDGASVGITTESTDYPVVFSNAYDTDYSGYFFADDENAHVNYNSEKKLELAADVLAHTHSWATAWSKNDTHHWHECTADGCDVTENSSKDGYAEHTYDREIATADYKASDATCTAKATYYKSCICGAKGTETFESGEVNASNHTFGAWIDEVPATCKTTGTKGHKDCTGCNKHFDADGNEITDLTIPVDPANHEGTLGDWVKTDPDKHWKEYSCCHVKAEEGTHVYTDDADTDCNTCGHERTIESAHTHPITDGGADMTWTGVSSLGEITGTGSYYLTGDILMNSNLNITGTVNLCLNGHKIYTKTGTSYGTVKIQTGAALNVCDCSENESGLITTCRGSYAIENSGTLNLYSGSVERSSDDNEAAVKVNTGAVFNMYGGKIGGNAKAILSNGTVNVFGGTVRAKRGAVQVEAGSEVTVSDNAALSVTGTSYSTIAIYGGAVNIRGGTVTNDYSAAVYAPSGESTLNISGGEISTAPSAKTDTIRLMSNSVEVTVTGGSITNGYASAATNTEGNRYGWAIDVYKVKSLTISGAPVINRIYLADSYRITVGEGGLTYETPIEIHCAKCPAPVTGANGTDYSSKFTPRNSSYAIINAEDNVVLFTKAATVTYTDGVDGEEIFPNQTHSTYLGQPTPAFNGTPQRTGYVFGGWSPEVQETVTGNTTYTAQWTVNQYTITFDTDGGSTVAAQTVAHGEKAVRPADPERNGFTFGGWYTDEDCTDGNEYDFDTPVTENITLYAKWSGHTHSWAADWSKNETHHWHECTADGCDVTNDADKNGYAEHTYDQEIATADYKVTDATCTAKATYYKSCICGAKGTETFESGEVNASNHTFGAWIDEATATCKTTGTKGHKDCTGCGKHFDASNNEITDLTIPVDPANHEGTLGDWVKTDPDTHWKDYSCCHVKAEEAAHTASDWITDIAATATTDGTKHKECAVCHRVLETGTIPATGALDDAPQTGDNSHPALWIALLFVSGGALIGTTVISKKRKRSAK